MSSTQDFSTKQLYLVDVKKISTIYKIITIFYRIYINPENGWLQELYVAHYIKQTNLNYAEKIGKKLKKIIIIFKTTSSLQ